MSSQRFKAPTTRLHLPVTELIRCSPRFHGHISMLTSGIGGGSKMGERSCRVLLFALMACATQACASRSRVLDVPPETVPASAAGKVIRVQTVSSEEVLFSSVQVVADSLVGARVREVTTDGFPRDTIVLRYVVPFDDIARVDVYRGAYPSGGKWALFFIVAAAVAALIIATCVSLRAY